MDLDELLQSAVPVVMVPKHKPFEELAGLGHRFLATSDGLWLEVRRRWGYFRTSLVKQSKVAMPYGEVSEAAQLSFGAVPIELLKQFEDRAKSRFPNECASWVIWDEVSGAFTLINLNEFEAGPARVVFERPRLHEHQHLIVDLHSHGAFSAFFSTDDDQDDKGEVKLAGVIGDVGGTPSWKFRMCLLGQFLPFTIAQLNSQ
jgi:PRTRC genetic system protein A